MTEKKSDLLPVADPYNVPVVFSNTVAGFGFYAGNINLTLAVMRFTPTELGDNARPIDPDLAIVARLRLDLGCAEQLYEQLGKLLQQTLKPANATTQ